MGYEKLKETKFFENYQKALKGELVLVKESCEVIIKGEKIQPKINKKYLCVECGKVLIEENSEKYIIDKELKVSFLKEIRAKCLCGKVNVFKGNVRSKELNK